MRKAMVPLAVILSVMTILLAAVWMRYARDIRELETGWILQWYMTGIIL